MDKLPEDHYEATDQHILIIMRNQLAANRFYGTSFYRLFTPTKTPTVPRRVK